MNFTMSLAREMAPYNVNVNAINPGLLWTNIWEKGHGVIIGADTDRPARRVFDEYVEATVPLGPRADAGRRGPHGGLSRER